MGNTATTTPPTENRPENTPNQTTGLVQEAIPFEPTLPPKPSVELEQQNIAPYKEQLAAEALQAKISIFHLAGLQLAVKEGHLSQEHADAIKAKVKDGALKSDGVDLILTAVFKDPEQFKKSFGSSAGGNIAAVLRDMDDEISMGLNSHSWGENKYYKPILQELVSIERNGFATPEKGKPTRVPNRRSPEPKPDSKSPDVKPDTSTDYQFSSGKAAINDLGSKLIAVAKLTNKPDQITAGMVKISAQSVDQLDKQNPAISEKDLFYLGYYRLQLESSGQWKEKTPAERNKLFIDGVTKDENSLKKAIARGKELASALETGLKQVKDGAPAYTHAQAAIDIIESVKSSGNQTAPKPTTATTATNYTFNSASVALNDLLTRVSAMEKATPGPDRITSQTIKTTTECVNQLDRKMPGLSEKDLFYLGFLRMHWEFDPSLNGKTAKEKNDIFIAAIAKSQNIINKAIQEGRELASRTESDLRKAKPGTPKYKDAQKVIAIFDAVERN